jgi:hypothetical protein
VQQTTTDGKCNGGTARAALRMTIRRAGRAIAALA